MNYILSATLYGAFGGILGTCAGGLLSLFFHKKDTKVLGFVFEYSAGLMISVVCFDLLPEAFGLASFLNVFCGMVTGILIAMYMQEKLKFSNKAKKRNNGFITTGLLMFATIGIHNFPEGLVIGSGFDISKALGISLTIVIVIHDIPEGLALALPLREGGYGALKAVLFAALSGVPTAFGAFVGAFAGHISTSVIALCLSVAAGIMLYVSVGDLIPEAKKNYTGRFSILGNVLGILSGILISKVL